MQSADLARVVDQIYTTYPQFGKVYGERPDIVARVVTLLGEMETALKKASKANGELFILDWAGIGDAIHSRLIAQTIAQTKKVVWITPIASLFKDDSLMTVLPCPSFPYRDVRQHWIIDGLARAVDNLAREYIRGELVHISKDVGIYWHTWMHNQTDYADLFFSACKVERDPKVKHSLVHKGKSPIDGKYVCIENASFTLGTMDIKSVPGLTLVHLGGPSDPKIEGTIDRRGTPLYDTFSILKGCEAFIGRASGNQMLMSFLPDIPVFEVDVPLVCSMVNLGYHNDIRRVELKDLPKVLESMK
jgi:hypothetical protein